MRAQASAPGRYRGQRRLADRRGRTGHRRVLAVAAAVGAVLIGTAALARTLPSEPTASPAGSTTPPEKSSASPATAEPAQPGTSAPPSESPAPSPPPAGEQTEAPPEVAPTPGEPPAPSPTAPPEPVDLSLEAESAELSGFVRLFAVGDASGGDVVGMIGNHESSNVRFDEVAVEAAGEYELTLYYLTAPDREALVSINDGDPIIVEFPGLGDLQTVDSVSVPVELAAGENEIWFGHVSGPAPALDRITITS